MVGVGPTAKTVNAHWMCCREKERGGSGWEHQDYMAKAMH